jgi:Protein of unknown function (DUF3551)
MRMVLGALGLFVVATLPTQASAQNYPWCAIYGNGDQGRNCGFTSFQQCQDDVRGIGGSCQRNTLYQAPAGPHARSRGQ